MEHSCENGLLIYLANLLVRVKLISSQKIMFLKILNRINALTLRIYCRVWSIYLFKMIVKIDFCIVYNWRLSYLPTPPLGQDMNQGQFFKRSLTGLNSEFSFF